jgi:inosine-uridine nucleoside N-ribohydrolase
MTKQILIDTDPGIDDTLAILLALASPELELKGLSVVCGNCTVDQGVKNALGVLEMLGSRIPVARGADRPLVQPVLIAPETHGGAGIGYARLPVPASSAIAQRAAEFIIEQVLTAPGQISLVCIGPLTNLAVALRLEPSIVSAIPEVIIMGGAVRHPGNTTPQAEFNIFCDPHAAHIVFHSGLPITLVPLDVTYQAILTQQDVDRLLRIPSPVSRLIADATRFYMEFHDQYQKIEGCVINDPLALALTFMPDLVDLHSLYVDVDISGGVSLGNTFADFYHLTNKTSNMSVALGVRAREFIELFVERMEVLCRSYPEREEVTGQSE